MLVVVDDVKRLGRLGDGRFANLLDGLGDGHVLVHGEAVWRHDAPGRLLAVLEELLDLLGLLLLHEVQDLLGLLLRQLLQNAGGIRGLHPVQGARDLRLVQRPDQLEERLVIQLGENGAGLLSAQQPEYRDLVVDR
jgi:hypothetical protein